MNNLVHLVLSLPAVLSALTIHEYAHGYVAYRMGDPTAKIAGRLTLNPIKHIDIFGFIAFILFRFGWAKPVPINPYNFRDVNKGILYTSIAGSLANFLLAFVFGMIRRILPITDILLPLVLIVEFGILFNLILCIFNLLPIPPLDGSKVLFTLLPPRYRHIEYWLERYGFMILIGLIFFDRITGIPVLWGWIGPFVMLFGRLFAGSFLIL
jgi:Zn-dependent protease